MASTAFLNVCFLFRSWDVWKPPVLSDSWRGVWWTQCSHYTTTSGSTRYFCSSGPEVCLKMSDIFQVYHRFTDLIRHFFGGSSVSVFSEAAPSDSTEQASQSVPMVSTSTPGLPVPGAANAGEEGDDSLLEPDADRFESLCCLSYSHVQLYICSALIHVSDWSFYFRPSAEVSVDPGVSQGSLEEPSQQSDKPNMPSTSQEPSSSSAGNATTDDIYVTHLFIYPVSTVASTDRCITFFFLLLFFRH